MTADQQPSPNATRLERTYDAPAELIWELWTKAAGIEEWWAPDGFKNRVSKLELRPGGQLVYTMTATAPKRTPACRLRPSRSRRSPRSHRQLALRTCR